MNDAQAMSSAQRAGNFDTYFCGALQLNRTSSEALCQGLALDVLLDEVVGTDIVQRANVGMIERGDCVSFALKPAAEPFGGDLNGDYAIQACVASFINLAHTSRPDLRQNLIRTEPGCGRQRHRESLDGA
jgi:hypothetical protein